MTSEQRKTVSDNLQNPTVMIRPEVYVSIKIFFFKFKMFSSAGKKYSRHIVLSTKILILTTGSKI